MPSSELDRTICVVQARMGSSRLPGKVLAELGGRPMLRFQLDRLADLAVDELVVATSDRELDDPIAELATRSGVGIVRGPENDVLGRYLLALDHHPAGTVVRLTGDCPLSDPEIVEAVLGRHRQTGADYTSNVLPRTFPKGLDVEVIDAAALRTAGDEARLPLEREHVTPYLYRHPERFRLANLRSGDDLGRERWTVDTPEDLDTVRAIVAAVGGDGRFGWREALERFGVRRAPRRDELVLRPAGPEDRDLLLAWRNDPETVRNSRTARPVEPSEHATWLAGRLDDPATRLSVAELDGRPVGQVRVDVEDAVGTVSITVAPDRRGLGLGAQMLDALTAEMENDVQVDRLVADVLPVNEASRRAFLRASFTRLPPSDGFDRFGLSIRNV